MILKRVDVSLDHYFFITAKGVILKRTWVRFGEKRKARPPWARRGESLFSLYLE
jgi:hypothetical protein